MTQYDGLAANTPVLVGAGQVVQREADARSPLQLAAAAARAAVADCGGTGVAARIDTVSVTRLFSDSMGFQSCPFGGSNNPPMSLAAALGANPAHCIYGQVGGNEPQARVIEFARDIAAGSRGVVLLAGGEATFNQRSAERAGRDLDWKEEYPQPVDDRGWGKLFVSEQELANGMLAPIHYYALIEQAQAAAAGDNGQWRERMAQLCAGMSEVAAVNPVAQFPQARSAADLLSAPRLNHLYHKGMIARDSVNLGAALLLCSVGCARELGIPEDNWVFVHGLAQGEDVNLSQREDPGRSAVLEQVLARVLEQAEVTDPGKLLIDIYSCFPCAVFAAADALGLDKANGRALTLTGGLPFFGGPGNNYAMHGIAEAISRLRHEPEGVALVTAVGGMLSKHAAGIYSRRPSDHDWSRVDTHVDSSTLPYRDMVTDPSAGRLISYVVNFLAAEPVQVMALGEAGDGRRFIATTAPEDLDTVSAVLDHAPVGAALDVRQGGEGKLYFKLPE